MSARPSDAETEASLASLAKARGCTLKGWRLEGNALHVQMIMPVYPEHIALEFGFEGEPEVKP